MNSFLRSLANMVPAYRSHKKRVDGVQEERDRLAAEVYNLTRRVEELRKQLEGSAAIAVERDSQRRPKRRIASRNQKRELSEQYRKSATGWRLSTSIPPIESGNHAQQSVRDWVQRQIDAEPYCQKIEVLPGITSPGWSDPAKEKAPYYGLPDDLTNKRVLDIGCAEGFFSFEAEKRGAREVIGIDPFPDSIRRFNLVKAARQSNCSAFLMNVYDLDRKRLGTFDLVLFYGVFYHLKHPQYALTH